MIESVIVLYLLGIYMKYSLGKRILELEGCFDEYKPTELLIVSILWPIISFYYFLKWWVK